MRLIFFLLTICFYVLQSHAEVTVEDIVSDLNSVAQTATDAPTNCDGHRRRANYQVDTSGDPNNFHKEVSLASGPFEETSEFEGDEVSILTEEEAQKLFEEFSKIDYMKFDYLHDGCFARAHEFALIAKEHGIEMGKVFLSENNGSARLYPKEWLGNSKAPVPNGFVGWRYHVAPYVLVKKEGKLVPTVLDVGVSPKAKPVHDWQLDMIQGHPEKFTTIYRDRKYMYEDGRSTYEGQSNIGGQFEDQRLMRELGIDEFIFRREQGWL